MRKAKIILTLLLLSTSVVTLIVFYACKRKKDVDFIGPEFYAAPEDFQVLSFSAPDDVDFTVAPCTLAAEFSSKVSWTATFKGLTSEAVKTIKAASDKIDFTNGIWTGGHDGLYFFRTGEKVLVTLSFYGTNLKYTDTINITKAKNFFQDNPNIIPVGRSAGGVPVNNYESIIVNFPYQFSFNSVLADGSHYVGRRNVIKAVNGSYYFEVTGKSSASDGYFIDGLQHRTGFQTTASSFYLPDTWTDPSKIYFNVYLYGSPASANTRVNLEFHESDFNNPTNSSKKSCGGENLNAYGHDPCTDDGYTYEVPLDFTGWKLVSVKYSDFTRNNNPTNGGNGNKIMEPTRVARVQLGVISNPPKNLASAIWDFPVLTYGAPFDPSK